MVFRAAGLRLAGSGMFGFVFPLFSCAGIGFPGFQKGQGTNLAPPLLTSHDSNSARKCWCQVRNPWSWIMSVMSMPAALCSATGLFTGLAMNWSSRFRNCTNRALLRVETSLRFAMVTNNSVKQSESPSSPPSDETERAVGVRELDLRDFSLQLLFRFPGVLQAHHSLAGVSRRPWPQIPKFA